jgi:hypothetical protein
MRLISPAWRSLLRRFTDLLARSRRNEAEIVVHLAELCCGPGYVV